MILKIEVDQFGSGRSLNDLFKYHKYILFGAGEACCETIKYLNSKEGEIVALSDNNEKLHGKFIYGYRVISPDKIPKLLDSRTAIVITSSFQFEIAKQLIEHVCIDEEKIFPYVTEMFVQHYDLDLIRKNEESINQLLTILSDNESIKYIMSILSFRWAMNPLLIKPNPKLKSFYLYDESIIGPFQNDLIIDCGAYNGDTAQMYLERLNGMCKIYAIEAYRPNFQQLKRWIFNNDIASSVVPINSAVGSQSAIISFRNESQKANHRASVILANDTVHSLKVQMNTLDELFLKQKKQINFIKMDIEGGEIDALMGAKTILSKYRPSLALAAYHNPADLWNIPLLLKEINPNYKIFAGHHPKCIYETEYYVGN